MMGGHHAASGAAAWVAVTSTTPIAFGWYPVSEVGVMTGALVCAGAALLPDVDHHNGTIAHSLPPVTEKLTRTVSWVSKGHRNGTHSLLGIAVFTVIAWLASWLTITTDELGEVLIGPGIMAVLLIAFALRALHLTGARGRWWTWSVSLSLAALVAVFAPEEWYWMPFCVALGCLIHVLGDWVTTRGVPWFWPRRRRYAWPVLGRAGSWREWAVMTPVSVYALVGVTWAALDQMGFDTGSVWGSLWA